jgi:hypothetical protein
MSALGDTMKLRIIPVVVAFLIVMSGVSLTATAKQDGTDLEATVEAMQTQIAARQTQVAALAPSTPPPAATSTTPGHATPTPSSDNLRAGETPMTGVVQFGDFEFSVTHTEVATELEDSSGFLSYTPNNGVFLIVTMSIRNIGTTSQPFPFDEFVIEEEFGAQYDTNSLNSIYFGDDYDSDDALIPGNTYVLDTLFDIPPQAKNLVYKSQDGSVIVRLDR